MNTNAVIVVCTVIATVVGVVGFLLKVRDTAKKQAEAEQVEKLRIRGEAYADGARSRDDEVRLVISERDQARHERREMVRELVQARAELTAERNRRET